MKEIRDAGAELVAVSVDSVDDSRRLAESLGLEYPVLADIERRVVRDWGVVHPGGGVGGTDIARPAVFLVEADGVVSWRSVPEDWRVRLRPETVIEVLQAR